MKQCEGQLTTVSQKQSGKCCFEAKDGINNLTGLKIDKGKNDNDNAEDRLYQVPTLTLTLSHVKKCHRLLFSCIKCSICGNIWCSLDNVTWHQGQRSRWLPHKLSGSKKKKKVARSRLFHNLIVLLSHFNWLWIKNRYPVKLEEKPIQCLLSISPHPKKEKKFLNYIDKQPLKGHMSSFLFVKIWNLSRV